MSPEPNGPSFITPLVNREFMNVSPAQRAIREKFLKCNKITVLSPVVSAGAALTDNYKKIFSATVASKGVTDADLYGTASALNFSVLTGDRKMFNFVTQTLGVGRNAIPVPNVILVPK